MIHKSQFDLKFKNVVVITELKGTGFHQTSVSNMQLSLVDMSSPNSGEVFTLMNCALLCIPHLPVSEWLNGTVFSERPWPEGEKWLLVAVLGLEMIMGVVGNGLVLLVKVMVRLSLILVWNVIYIWCVWVQKTIIAQGCRGMMVWQYQVLSGW